MNLSLEMLTVHNRYPLQSLSLPEGLGPIQCIPSRVFPAVKSSAWKLSNTRKLVAHKLAFEALFRTQGYNMRHLRAQNLDTEFEALPDEFEDEDELDGPQRRFREREERDYDRDPEFAEILGSCLDDPEKARSKMEERLRKKRNKLLHTKTGSTSLMKVTFNKFEFLNSYIWFELYNAPLEKDISLLCDTIRSWHIIGRLGGCNSMNMQLSQAPLDKRPHYDAIQGANVEPSTFYNIGDLEIQDNLARVWVDIGTSEPLVLDVLLIALTQINSDFVGIKQVVFGGSELENWKENFTSEEAGCSVHKI